MRFKQLFCLPGMAYIPTILSAIKLFSGNNKEVHAIRSIKASTRSSTIIKAFNPASHDPVLNVVKTFCEVHNKDVKEHIVIISADDVFHEICEEGNRNMLNLIVMPWLNTKLKAPDQNSNLAENNNIIRALQSKWKKSVAVVMNGIPSAHTLESQSILVPYFGGPDDREALLLALDVGNHPQNKIHVLHIRLVTEDTSNCKKLFELEDEDKNLLREIMEVCNNSSSLKGKLTYEEVKTEVSIPLIPVIRALQTETYSMVIFGQAGSTWVSFFSDRIPNDYKDLESLAYLSYINFPESSCETIQNYNGLTNASSNFNYKTTKSLKSIFTPNPAHNQVEPVVKILNFPSTSSILGEIGDAILKLGQENTLISVKQSARKKTNAKE